MAEPQASSAPVGGPGTLQDGCGGGSAPVLTAATVPAPTASRTPCLPETSKELLRRLAEELLTLNSQVDAANDRVALAEAAAAAAQQELQALRLQHVSGQPADVQHLLSLEQQRTQEAAEAAARATAEAAALRAALEEQQRHAEGDGDTEGLRQQVESLTRQVLELRGDVVAAAQQQSQAANAATSLQHQLQELQRRHDANEAHSAALLAEARRLCEAAEARADALQRELEQARSQQQQQRQRGGQLGDQQARMQQQQPEQVAQRRGDARAPVPEAAAAAADEALSEGVVDLAASGSGGSEASLSSSGLHSSQDAETIREPATRTTPAANVVPSGVPARGAAAAAQQQQQRTGSEEAGAGAMRPPPQRLGGLTVPGALRKGAAGAVPAVGTRKRAAEEAAGEAAGALPSKQRRESAPAGGQLAHAASSPGESEMAAAAVLQRNMRRAPGGNSGVGGQGSPSHHAAGQLLSLKKMGAAGAERKSTNGEGGRRRGGSGRASGVSGGGMALKEGETAEQWLNRSALKYVQGLLKERDFQPFWQPVRDVKGYDQVIKRPMDLGTIKGKAAEGRYRIPKELGADLLLVVENARTYNEDPSHPVHRAADRLLDYLQKPFSFYNKMGGEFEAAKLEEVVAEQRKAQEAELQAAEQQLADSVDEGLNLAVYAEDDEQRNKYYVIKALARVRTLQRDEVDDFGAEFRRGDCVVEGHYYDYWLSSSGHWDPARRPYYLQRDKRCFVPAASLLLVDFDLHKRPEPELSPYSGLEEEVFEVTAALHQQLKQAVKKFTAEL